MPRPRTTRSEDLAFITEHHGSFHEHRDLKLFRDLFRKLGWDAFTDEAIEDLADRYEFAAVERERRDGLRSDHSEQEAA